MLLMLAWLAAATPEPTVVSAQVPAFFARGAELQAERYFDTRWSAAVSLGGRQEARADFHSGLFSVGAELRLWLWRHVLATLDSTALGGSYAFARADLGWSWLSNQRGTLLGDGFRITPTLGVGHRLLPWLRFELTPAVGVGFETTASVSPALLAHSRMVLTLGLTIGWVL